MKALLVVDIQNDFLSGGALAVKNGDDIIPLVNNLQSEYDLVVATQDWHPHGHKSFVTQYENKNAFDQIDLNGIQQTLWPEHCVQESWGAQFPASLQLKNVAAIFRKGMNPNIDSYSGFYDNAKLSNTGLDGYLKAKNITEVDICGLAADFCVYFTAMDALDLGFKATILLNATRAIDNTSFEEKKNLFIQRGGIIK